MTVNWDAKISLRDVLQLVTLLVGGFLAWQSINLRLTLVEQRMAAQEEISKQQLEVVSRVERYLCARDPSYCFGNETPDRERR